MTTLLVPRTPAPARPATRGVIRALARTELRRTLRNPVLAIGLSISTWYLWSLSPRSEDWSGATYAGMATTSAPLLLAMSLVTAASFHRERTEVAPASPVPAGVRVVARLLATVPLLAVAALFAVAVGWRQRALGGMPLGVEPGRTAEALQTHAELAQHIVLGLVAVALGAAVGRRVGRLVAAVPVLFLVWFVVAGAYWIFGAPSVTPFSVVQVQPVTVLAGPGSVDPITFPQQWLLEAPSEYQDGWARLFVSSALAWWHAVWLVGLAALLVAAAVPRGTARRTLVLGGTALAVIGVVAQVQVIP